MLVVMLIVGVGDILPTHARKSWAIITSVSAKPMAALTVIIPLIILLDSFNLPALVTRRSCVECGRMLVNNATTLLAIGSSSFHTRARSKRSRKMEPGLRLTWIPSFILTHILSVAICWSSWLKLRAEMLECIFPCEIFFHETRSCNWGQLALDGY